MKKSLYFLFILALFCLTGCKDALVPKPIKLTCNINTFDAPISCISRSTADADKLYIGQEDGCIIEKVNNNCQTYSINSNPCCQQGRPGQRSLVRVRQIPCGYHRLHRNEERDEYERGRRFVQQLLRCY